MTVFAFQADGTSYHTLPTSTKHIVSSVLVPYLSHCSPAHDHAGANGDSSPRKAFARKVDMPRPSDHPDVLRYRYSNGLCPDVYQVSCPTFAAVK